MDGDHHSALPYDDHQMLSTEQQKVVELIDLGKNVFFTGAAGTGKSYLLKFIIKHSRLKRKDVAITATTGISSLQIGGRTIHSFAGFGLGKEDKEFLAEKVYKSLKSRNRWCKTEILIIDEISMLDGDMFDKLEFIARRVRNDETTFGGLQLVLCGDFFQLPPVPERSHDHIQPSKFAFNAESWSRCISRPIFLNKVFRQKDSTFIDILTNMRRGALTKDDNEKLSSLSRPLTYPDEIEPSQLYPRRDQVENHNRMKLEALPGPQIVYPAMDSAGYDARGIPILRKEAEKLLERVMSPSMISLKVGAQVMLIQNLEAGVLVNGSLGKVIGFTTISEAIERNLNLAEFPTSSRNSNYSQAIPTDFRPLTNYIFGRQQLWPIVKFTNEEERVFPATEFTVPGPVGNIEVHRMQVPLILAWAISIHKSQGQTLERVKIDLESVFEKGQAYVAVSRATSMEGLEIQNFNASRVFAHPDVIQWHNHWSSLGDGDLLDGTDDDANESD